MKPHSLLKTSVVRMSLRYTLLYALLLALLYAVLYLSSLRYIDAQLEERLASEIDALVDVYNVSGLDELRMTIENLKSEGMEQGRFYLLAEKDGLPVAGNLTKWPHEANVLIDSQDIQNIWLDDDIMIGDFYINDAYLPAAARKLPDDSRLLVAYGIEQDNLLRELSENLKESFGAAILFMLLLSFTLGKAILRRVETINQTASEIMSGDLSRRIPLSKRHDEFDHLAQRLNEMLDRIEGVLRSMRDVTDNIAHDLKSPITRIRNRMEVLLLQEQRTEEEYREALAQTIKDADFIIKTFNAVLQTAQADAGTMYAEFSLVDLSRLVREVGELFAPSAEDAGLDFRTEHQESVFIKGNCDLLGQAICNLLDNAIKFTPRNGQVSLELVTTSSGADIIIADTGPGIPTHEYERVRQRFVRLDTSGQTTGNGLGLSLVDAIVRQHGASLLFDDNNPGLRAIIRFAEFVSNPANKATSPA